MASRYVRHAAGPREVHSHPRPRVICKWISQNGAVVCAILRHSFVILCVQRHRNVLFLRKHNSEWDVTEMHCLSEVFFPTEVISAVSVWHCMEAKRFSPYETSECSWVILCTMSRLMPFMWSGADRLVRRLRDRRRSNGTTRASWVTEGPVARIRSQRPKFFCQSGSWTNIVWRCQSA